ncbi:hypothetical protein HC766_04265, partial [Candidatus Gracilibacteria bacterium]|nr:hypothetical protein [Candidatus Gracilibacteria bacterium]
MSLASKYLGYQPIVRKSEKNNDKSKKINTILSLINNIEDGESEFSISGKKNLVIDGGVKNISYTYDNNLLNVFTNNIDISVEGDNRYNLLYSRVV